MTERPTLVVLDIAGTTVRDDGQVPAAFRAALAAHGIDATEDAVSRVRGASKREAVLRFVPEGPDRARRAELVYESFRTDLSRRYRERVTPVDGAEELFRSLREAGTRVALNTGFDRDITRLLLDALAWSEGVVDAVVCGDDVSRGRPAPDLILRAMAATGVATAARVASAGDTRLDLEAGHAAGVRWNVGVLSGAHGRELLASAPHTHLLASIAELPALWD
jgi:phosphonatase-like hydrolase